MLLLLENNFIFNCLYFRKIKLFKQISNLNNKSKKIV